MLSNEEKKLAFDELSEVMNVLERNVEWTMSDYINYNEVKALLFPIRNAVNEKLREFES